MRAPAHLSPSSPSPFSRAPPRRSCWARHRDPNGLRRSVVSIENTIGELCSGAVIAPDLVLTAAHCMTDRASYRVVARQPGLPAAAFRVVATAVHPAFVPGTTPRTQPGVDLAILKLERPLGPEFLPLDPRLAGRIETGGAVTIAGFGVLSERAEAHRPHPAPDQSGLARPRAGGEPRRHRRRPGAPGRDTGAGACRGDSGGPILVRVAGLPALRHRQLVERRVAHAGAERLRRPHRRDAGRRASRLDPIGRQQPRGRERVMGGELNANVVHRMRRGRAPPRRGRPCAGHPDPKGVALLMIEITGTRPVMT